MTYHELVAKAKEVYGKADASAIRGHLAVQFNVTGEGEGAFYIEVTDGVVDIQPFEYYDRNAIMYIPGNVLYDILDSKIELEDAYNDLMLGIEGDLGAALLLKQIRLKKKDKNKDKEKDKVVEEVKTEEIKQEELKKEESKEAVEEAEVKQEKPKTKDPGEAAKETEVK